MGAIIAVVMTGTTLLTTIGTALQIWWSQNPAWPWFKTSLAAFLCSLILMLVVLGQEFRWWHIEGEIIDNLGIIWLAINPIVIAITYWLVR